MLRKNKKGLGIDMKRQRSKQELLAHIQTYQAIQKDKEKGSELREKTVYWRLGVEWCCVLWKEEKFSTSELVKVLEYVANNTVTDLTDETREEIRNMLDSKVKWTLINKVQVKKHKNEIDRAVNELEFYNTEKAVDYSLLVIKYLITEKGYSTKRLNRVIGSVNYLDKQSASMIMNLRQDLFDKKRIWIDLNDDKPEDVEKVI